MRALEDRYGWEEMNGLEAYTKDQAPSHQSRVLGVLSPRGYILVLIFNSLMVEVGRIDANEQAKDTGPLIVPATGNEIITGLAPFNRYHPMSVRRKRDLWPP